MNSRPVGVVHLATDTSFGPSVAKIHELRIEEPDRGRGRGTVAALAAEEVARGWGCRQIEVTVPGAAPDPGCVSGTDRRDPRTPVASQVQTDAIPKRSIAELEDIVYLITK